MATKQEILIELGIVAIISYLWFFVSTNVNPTLGNIYGALTVGAIVAVFLDLRYGKKVIPLINPSVSWIKAIIVALISYVILILSTQFATTVSKIIPLTEVLSSLAASAPIFSNSVSLNFIIFAFLIAYIESYAIFVALLDLTSSMFNIALTKENLFNPKLLGLIAGIASFFLLLHATIRGIDAESDLILVFIMAIISMILIILYKEGRIPILFHIIANSVAGAFIFGIVDPASFMSTILSLI